MRKGNIGLAISLLVTLIVGVFMVDTMCAPWCNCVDGTDITDTNVVSDPVPIWENHTCDGTKCDSDYQLTCGGFVMVPGDDYSILDCDYRLENTTLNASTCVLEYTYEGDNYHGTDVTGLVVCNIPVIALILGFIVAGGYALMKR